MGIARGIAFEICCALTVQRGVQFSISAIRRLIWPLTARMRRVRLVFNS